MPGGKSRIRPEDGKQFSSENQPPNRGRKPRVFSQLSREWKERGIERATPEAVKEAFEYVLALHLLDVKAISGRIDDEKNDMPMVVRLAAKELLGRRSLEILREMLNRAHGGIRTPLDVNLGGKLQIVDGGEFTAEQLDKIEKAISPNGRSDGRNTLPTGKPGKAGT